jgi:hypothetical protein
MFTAPQAISRSDLHIDIGRTGVLYVAGPTAQVRDEAAEQHEVGASAVVVNHPSAQRSATKRRADGGPDTHRCTPKGGYPPQDRVGSRSSILAQPGRSILAAPAGRREERKARGSSESVFGTIDGNGHVLCSVEAGQQPVPRASVEPSPEGRPSARPSR